MVVVQRKLRKGFVDQERARLEAEAAARKELRDKQQELLLLRRAERALEARDNLLTFTQFTMPDPDDPNDIDRSRYEVAPVHRTVAAALDDFLDDRLLFDDGSVCDQLIICMPPRIGKTELSTKRMTARYLGRHPTHNVAVGAYSDTLAQEFGGDTRAIMSSPQYKQTFPNFRLRRGGNAKDNLETVEGGRALFVGRGGALTGRGANLLIVDDLYKDHEEARSEAIRNQAWHWFTKVAMTRLMRRNLGGGRTSNAKVLIVMTRWHSDDIIGRITDPQNDHYIGEDEAAKWKIIRLAAIAEEDDPLGRKPGEVLWPERFSADFLRSRQRMDPLGFAALYQQRPTVADGTLFRREAVQYYDKLPDSVRFYCSSDHAVGTNQRNDPSCLLKVAVDQQDNIYLVDAVWKRMPADMAVEAMLTMAGGNMRPLLWWAERGHISKSIGPFLRKRMAETGTYINLVEVTPASDKQQRAQSIAARFAMGKVFFPRNALWTQPAIDELLAFPNGNHDDFVDALAYIGLGLTSQFGPTRAAEKPRNAENTFAALKEWTRRSSRPRELVRGGF